MKSKAEYYHLAWLAALTVPQSLRTSDIDESSLRTVQESSTVLVTGVDVS